MTWLTRGFCIAENAEGSGHPRGSRDPETLSRSRSVSERILRLEELGHAEGAEYPSDHRLARIPRKATSP